MVAMLLYLFETTSIEAVTLRYFEPNHGQSEGDSAHSAIGYMQLKRLCDLFVPS